MHHNQDQGPDDDELQDSDQVPNFLTARELQARDPGKPPANEDDVDGDDETPAKDKPASPPRRRPGANPNS